MTSTFDNAFNSIDDEFGIFEEPVVADASSNAAINFETAFHSEHYKVSYKEVAPLVTTALVDHMFSREPNEDMVNIAGGLLELFGSKSKPFVPGPNDSEKKIIKRLARHTKREAIKEGFLNKWSDVLGYVGGWAEVTENFVHEANSSVANNPLLFKVEYAANYELLPNTPLKFGSRDNRKVLSPSKGYPVVDNLGELVLAILVKACSNLSSAEKVDLICDLDGLKKNPVIQKTASGTGVIMADFMFDLGDASISRILSQEGGNVSLGRKQTAIKAVFFNKSFVVSGDNAVFIWMLNSMRMTAKGLAQAINLSSNFFKQEINYGCKLAPTDIAYHVYENMLKQGKISLANTTHFPYSNLSNAKLDVSTLSWVLDRGIFAMCDKQNKSWVVLNAGAESLFIGRDVEGNIVNLNDMAKPTKLLNRGAANVYLFAEIL